LKYLPQMGLRRYCIAAFRAGQRPLWVRSGHHPLT